MAKIPTHRKKTKQAMVQLGIYKPEFDDIISRFAELNEQYDELQGQFKKSGYVIQDENGRRLPLVVTLESLRKDILNYAKELGITPHGLLKFDESAFTTQKNSKFDKVMDKLLSE